MARGAGDAEVGDADRLVGGEEQVRGLHVAVDDPARMRDVERRPGLVEPPQRRLRLEWAGPETLGERPAGRVLHDDEGEPVLVLAHVVDRDDERLSGQARSRLRLSHEARVELLVLRVPLGQHLDRDRPAENLVLRAKHVAHAAVRDRLPVGVARRKRGPLPRHQDGVPARAARESSKPATRGARSRSPRPRPRRARDRAASRSAAEACAPRRARSSAHQGLDAGGCADEEHPAAVVAARASIVVPPTSRVTSPSRIQNASSSRWRTWSGASTAAR